MPKSDSTSQKSSSQSPKLPTPQSGGSLPLRVLHSPGFILALIIYLICAFFYFFIVPIFEGPDEWTHTGHVKYIAQGNGLPVMLPGQGIWGGQQPPLYYSIGALLVQPFELKGVEDFEKERRNPHAAIGFALDPGNKNSYLHNPDEAFPYRGLSLTVHMLRLYSILLGLITLIFIYLTAYEIYNVGFTIYDSTIQNPAWFAASVAMFVAAQPMYAFINASVANEPANIAACAVAVFLSQRYVLYGPASKPWRAVALGVTLGLVSLAKMTGLSVGLVAVVAFLIVAITTRKQPGASRLLWRDGLIIGTLFLLVGGWWYWRNYQLYGDFFQQGLYKIYFNVDPQPLSLSQFIYTLRTGEISFWATFGWLNIVAPEWVYSVYRIISRVGFVGVIAAVVVQLGQRNKSVGSRVTGSQSRRVAGSQSRKLQVGSNPQRAADSTHHAPCSIHPSSFIFHPLVLHVVFPLALAFSLTRLVATEGGLQGRQLLPALGSVSIVVMWGWWALLPQKARPAAFGLLFALLFGLAVWLPYSVVAKAYIPPSPITHAQLPADLIRLDWTYNDDMKLLGIKIGAEIARPGERVPVTAYWQALRPMQTNYSVFTHLIGRDQQVVGQFNTYPGLGLRPTTGLQPGQIIVDSYPVLVERGSQAPSRLLVNLGLFDFKEPGRPGIPATAPDGTQVPPTVGRLKLIPVEWPQPTPPPPIADFAENIRLGRTDIQNCSAPTENCEVTFEWQPQGVPAENYTVFVQLWQNDQHVTGFDSPPLNGDYPTGMWAFGEVILDSHRLDLSDLPPGQYQILVGLYDFETGERLPAFANDQPLPDYAVNLGQIELR